MMNKHSVRKPHGTIIARQHDSLEAWRVAYAYTL